MDAAMNPNVAEQSFRCPVCRASQVLSPTCRRCRADLDLVFRAHSTVDGLVARWNQAASCGDGGQQSKIAQQLRLLAPVRLQEQGTGDR